MAKTKQEQLMVIYLTICLVVVSLLMKVDSVSTSSIPLDGNGNMLQQHEQQEQLQLQEPQQTDNHVQEHNYVMDLGNQKPTVIALNNPHTFIDDADDVLKEKSLSKNVIRNPLNFGYPYSHEAMVKRAPSGFLGMRGKKLYTSDDDDENNNPNDNDVSFKLPWNHLENSNEDINCNEYAKPNARHYKEASTTFYEDMVKRAPAGFLGMRGKKLYTSDDDENNNDDDGNNNESDNDVSFKLPWNHLENSNEDINWNEYAKPNVRRYKKASTTFYGVRGKKFSAMNGANSNSDNHRWHDFLQKLEEERARDAILQDFVERLAGTKNDLTSDMTKRAPTGFTGVRGKRLYIDELDPSIDTKRGLGNNAFVGVRGKKDVSHQTFKRSPAGAERTFFGFLKKSLRGGNGKRQRFVDFNNKFVAVRGKKSSYDDLQSFNDINSNGSPLAPMSLPYDKRAPNGFLGMRGKRPLTSDNI